jgi:uncharacterized tellurite resistance protein B-like protein
MLKTLKDLFDAFGPTKPGEPPQRSEHLLQLAAAVLLVEVMRSDHDIGADEQEAVLAALQGKFALSRDESERLVELAHDSSRSSTDYFAFTSRINDAFGMEQKIRMVEYMWQVAYADGTLNAHENHVMRRLSDLLHVPHGAYVNAKMRAAQAGPVSGAS